MAKLSTRRYKRAAASKKNKKIQEHEFQEIYKQREAGLTWREISFKLEKKVETLKKAVRQRSKIANLPPKPKLFVSIIKGRVGMFLKRVIRQNNHSSLRKLSSLILKEFALVVSYNTIGRYLRRQGYQHKLSIRKPLISTVNRQKRLEFAEKFVSKSARFWSKVIWSDETSVQIFPKTRQRILIHPSSTAEKIYTPSTKSSVNIMFWGAFGKKGAGPLTVVRDKINSDEYKKILGENLLPYLKGLNYKYLFMHDNAPIHVSGSTKAYMLQNKIPILEWPPQSPDLNPIENIWAIIKADLNSYACSAKNGNALIQRVEEAWLKIDKCVWKNLIASMPKRMEAVINAKGGPTKY
jgi:transposase